MSERHNEDAQNNYTYLIYWQSKCSELPKRARETSGYGITINFLEPTRIIQIPKKVGANMDASPRLHSFNKNKNKANAAKHRHTLILTPSPPSPFNYRVLLPVHER